MDRLANLGFTLGVHDFCAFCPDFEPELEQVDCSTYGDQHDGLKKVLNIIRCEIKSNGLCNKEGERL